MTGLRPLRDVADEAPCSIRPAQAQDLEALAQLWHTAWHEAHDPVVPPALRRARTLEQFTSRMEAMLPRVAVAEGMQPILGFCAIQGQEVEHLFVHAQARGRGVARHLMKNGLAQIAATGGDTAHLFCLHGNRRGMRFYDRSGWTRRGLSLEQVSVPGGRVTLRSLRYEMKL